MHGWNLAPVLETIYLKKKKKTKMWIQGEFHKEKRSSRQFESHTLYLFTGSSQGTHMKAI